MNKILLRQYISTLIESDNLARVPNQLVNSDETKKKKNEEDNEVDINEFSAVSAIAGYIGSPGVPSEVRRSEKVHKKKSGWKL